MKISLSVTELKNVFKEIQAVEFPQNLKGKLASVDPNQEEARKNSRKGPAFERRGALLSHFSQGIEAELRDTEDPTYGSEHVTGQDAQLRSEPQIGHGEVGHGHD